MFTHYDVDYFSSTEKLDAHTVDCKQINDCAIRLPSEKDKWLEFGNYCNKERTPFVVYADLECVLRKMEPENTSRFSNQHHEVFSIGYYTHCSYDNTLSYYRFRRIIKCF